MVFNQKEITTEAILIWYTSVDSSQIDTTLIVVSTYSYK